MWDDYSWLEYTSHPRGCQPQTSHCNYPVGKIIARIRSHCLDFQSFPSLSLSFSLCLSSLAVMVIVLVGMARSAGQVMMVFGLVTLYMVKYQLISTQTIEEILEGYLKRVRPSNYKSNELYFSSK